MSDPSSSAHVACRSIKAEQVLDAAKRLFIEYGFGATSMDAIAQAAGVSKATVYAHHDSKQALFAATARRECARVVGQMAVANGSQDLSSAPDLEAALTRIGRSFVDAILSDEIMALLRMVIAEATRFPEIGRIYYESAPLQTRQNVTRYLEQARAQGLIQARDCELAASQFLGMLRGDVLVATLLGEQSEQRDNNAVIDEAVATFIARYACDVSQTRG